MTGLVFICGGVDRLEGLGHFRDAILRESQAQIARRAGVSPARISMLENGCIPKKRRIAQRYIDAYRLQRFPNAFFTLAQKGINK